MTGIPTADRAPDASQHCRAATTAVGRLPRRPAAPGDEPLRRFTSPMPARPSFIFYFFNFPCWFPFCWTLRIILGLTPALPHLLQGCAQPSIRSGGFLAAGFGRLTDGEHPTRHRELRFPPRVDLRAFFLIPSSCVFLQDGWSGARVDFQGCTELAGCLPGPSGELPRCRRAPASPVHPKPAACGPTGNLW